MGARTYLSTSSVLTRLRRVVGAPLPVSFVSSEEEESVAA